MPAVTPTYLVFQSTLPYGSDALSHRRCLFLRISIHAPLRERGLRVQQTHRHRAFQSTLPYGSELRTVSMLPKWPNFNPRSLTGAIMSIYLSCPVIYNFNPRSLTGATTTLSIGGLSTIFQSTLPYGSDIAGTGPHTKISISIHAPLRERRLQKSLLVPCRVFQSTLPYGSEPQHIKGVQRKVISIHAPLRERPALSCFYKILQISIHAPLRERCKTSIALIFRLKFQSTLPYGSEASKQITSLLI